MQKGKSEWKKLSYDHDHPQGEVIVIQSAEKGSEIMSEKEVKRQPVKEQPVKEQPVKEQPVRADAMLVDVPDIPMPDSRIGREAGNVYHNLLVVITLTKLLEILNMRRQFCRLRLGVDIACLRTELSVDLLSGRLQFLSNEH